jgi:O-antigen ligase
MRELRNLGNREKIFLFGFCLTILTVTPYSVMDPINLPKMSVLGVLAFTLLGYFGDRRVLVLFRNNWLLTIMTGLFVLQGLFVLVFSGRTLNESLYGASGRNTGFLTYLCFSILLISASQMARDSFIKSFQTVFIAVGLILTAYGLVQYFGLEPFPYINAYENNVFGTFGNPNFQSAFMGIFGALLFALVLDERSSLNKRLVLASFTVTAVFGIFITNSWQGFFNFAAGVGIAITLNLFRLRKERIGSIFLSLGIVSGIIVFLGLLNQGPLASILAKASLSARRLYWEAGVNMLLNNPLFGVGWDGFGDWFRRGRSLGAATNSGNLISDSAHSVPIDIASGGGAPLIILYLSLIAFGLFSVVRAVRRKQLTVNFIALVAAWGSYQAQSLISINQIGLGIVGWSLLGLIIGYSSVQSKEIGNSEEQKSKQVNKVQTAKPSFTSFVGPMIGLVIGCLIALPPFIAANKFYEGMKTLDARVINENAYLKPFDLQRMLYAASILEKNKFYKESIQIAKTITKSFPDSYDAWRFLATLTNATEVDKENSQTELRRLDPSRK